jgi:phage-related protein
METFKWCPRLDPQGSTQHRTLAAKFGDGYAQRAADGINNVYDSWSLTFTGADELVAPIKAFLDKHGGWRAFKWTPPLSGEKLFVAEAGYQLIPHGGDVYTLTVTFNQDFRP